jgi:rubredoxin
MKRYRCTVCGWVYDPEVGVPERGIMPGIPFEQLPADFTCPECGASKEDFVPDE